MAAMMQRCTCASVGSTPLHGRYAGSRSARTSTVARAFLPDLSHFSVASDAVHQLQHLNVMHLAEMAAPTAEAAKDAAIESVARPGAGPFDGLAKLMEQLLTKLDAGLEAVHVPYSYGFAIMLLTLIVKLATFPLTAKQVKSTVAIQAIQPRIKELQSKYPNDQERLQMETARLYKESGVNPLAGCLPTLATIPVFIGLYRALTLAAQDGLLNDGFFFVPSLGGPATIEQQLDGTGMQWLFPFIDGVPPLGWATTGAYLVLPVLLVISQSLSMKIMSPPSDDPAQAQTQAILKFLPFMIGYFSLNVPAGLTIYWLTNNVLTTAQQVYLKSTTKIDLPPAGGTIRKNVPTIDVQPDGASPASKPSGSRRSGKGEKFRARQSQDSVAVTRDARGKAKKKGSKFAERKTTETGAPATARTIDVKAEEASGTVSAQSSGNGSGSA